MSETKSAAAQAVACAHCGLPSPPPVRSDEPAFCCEGCRGAYHLIQGWGLQDYYALRDRAGGGASAQPVEQLSGFEELDDPAVLGQSAPRACGDDLLCSRLAVGGLHCGACAWLIERAARLHPGFQSARVRFNDHTVEIIYRPSRTRLSRIASDLSRLGYRLSPLVEDDLQSRQSAVNRALLIDIAIAGFCAANAMWLAIALYAGAFSGMAAEHAAVLRWAGVVLGLVAVAIPGRTFFRGAWASIETRTPHMDLPVALGLSVGAAAGLASVILGRGEVYFDSVATLVFLLLVGRWVQFRQQRRAADAVSLLMRLTPRLASRVEPSGSVRRVPADRLAAGDVVRVAAGETVPADGEVVSGSSTVDRSLVTGESRPVSLKPGQSVEAGCSNLEAPLDLRVTAAGRDSRAGKIAQLIEDAAADRAPIVQLADSIGGWFVVTVIALAAITVAVWWQTDPFVAAENAVALLIVACPCALALATPLALAVAIGRLARRHLLVRGGDVLERMRRPGTVWFDKTGTLTLGKLQLRHWEGDDESLRLAAAIERDSAHPAAHAIVAAARQRGLEIPAADATKQWTGLGAEGLAEGRRVLIGNRRFLESQGVEIDSATVHLAGQVSGAGASPILLAVDGIVTAVGSLADVLRPESQAVVETLRDRGWRVGILSGDHPETVRRVAEELGIENASGCRPRDRRSVTPADDEVMAVGGIEPEGKLQRIEASKRGGETVVMVGDGVNDAAALAAADVGIAIRGGAAASLEAAPVYLQSGELRSLVDLLDASRRTVRTIRRNFALSLSYNAVAVVLAMAGWINPLVAAILMPLSSLTVLSSVLVSPTLSARQP